MTRRGGLFDAFPGRLTVRVLVPVDLLDETDQQAAARGVDRAVMLGDLVAQALPDALAEAARDLLTRNAEAPVLAEGAGNQENEGPEAHHLRAARYHRSATDHDEFTAP